MPNYVYCCDKCGYIIQSDEPMRCPCGCDDDEFEHDCGGTIRLKCHCFKGNCAVMEEDIDSDMIYEMDDDISEMVEN